MYKRPYKNRYKISHLLKSIISNFLLEDVVFLMRYARISSDATGSGNATHSYRLDQTDSGRGVRSALE